MTWKFAFSTLGAPSAPLDDVLRTAAEHSVQGLELRVHEEEFLHLGLTGLRPNGSEHRSAQRASKSQRSPATHSCAAPATTPRPSTNWAS